MTVDFMRLRQCLAQTKAESGGDIAQRDIDPYLLENVILPFLNGKEVDLGCLDYSAFSPDDILAADDEIEAVACGAGRVARITELFKRTPPTVRKTKVYC